MQRISFRAITIVSLILPCALFLAGCGAQPLQTSVNVAPANTSTNANATNVATGNSNSINSVHVEAKEPEQYQAKVTVRFEAVGGDKAVALPSITATVARSGNDRRMEFIIPAGGHVVYLDKGGTNYLILPEKKQYAEINRDSTGFEIRRMLMPEEIVAHVQKVEGVEKVGEENYNGRDVVRYRYGAVANTQTQAGQVQTESFLLVDKETGLPLRSEVLSQASGSVQGYNGLRLITELGDIKTASSPDLFAPPTEFQKVEADQVRSQVDLLFQAAASIFAQIIKQGQTPAPTASSGGH